MQAPFAHVQFRTVPRTSPDVGLFLERIHQRTGTIPALTPVRSAAQDVGDRRGGFDFNYRVPGLRNWLTLYGDFFTDDDPVSAVPLHRRSAIMPGIYLAKFPFAAQT